MKENSRVAIFRKQLGNNALSHAYLLWGGDEGGKENALQECAELLLGTEYLKDPNFFELVPDTESGTISINAVRAMRARAFQTPWMSGRQVFVIRTIERISRDAFPVLLKILEEPPSGVLFLATTNNLERLSKPLRSRFSLVRIAGNPRSLEENDALLRMRELSLKKRWESIPKLLENEDFEKMLRSAILEKEQTMKKLIKSEGKQDGARALYELERLWEAYHLYQFDPTASKRLIGEYAMAFI